MSCAVCSVNANCMGLCFSLVKGADVPQKMHRLCERWWSLAMARSTKVSGEEEVGLTGGDKEAGWRCGCGSVSCHEAHCEEEERPMSSPSLADPSGFGGVVLPFSSLLLLPVPLCFFSRHSLVCVHPSGSERGRA